MASTLKLLYVTTVDMTCESGPMLHITATLRELEKLGCDIRLMVPKGPVGGRFGGIRARRRVFADSADQITIERPDLMYLRGSYPRLAAYARSRGVPVVVEYNGDLASELPVTEAGMLRRWLEMRREQRTALQASHGIVVDESIRDALGLRYPNLPFSVVPNGCEAELFRVDEERPANMEHLRLVFVGALQPWTHLTKVFEALQMQSRRYTLDVIGDGPRRAAFEAEVEVRGIGSRVNFLGRVPHQWLRQNLCRYDIGLSVDVAGRRNSPLKVPEYLAAGLAVAAAGARTLSYLRDEGFGAYAEGELQAGVLSAMIQRCSGADMLLPTARRERANYARRELSWARSAQGVFDVLQQIAGGAPCRTSES